MISGSNEHLLLELEYTLLKPDCYSWWISKMQSGREDTLEEWYAIKFCFKLGENAKETYGILQTYRILLWDHLTWTEHQFLSGIRDSRKAESLWGMMRGVGGVRKSIHQSWLAKGLWLGLELLCWGFKGIQEDIHWEEASTLEIVSVTFPTGQCTSPLLHPCHRLFDQDGHQDSSSPSLYFSSLWLLVIPKAQRLSLCDNWGDEIGCDEGHWHAHTRGLLLYIDLRPGQACHSKDAGVANSIGVGGLAWQYGTMSNPAVQS